MKFLGLLERSMGGIISIRGYAQFSDLAKISTSKDYQRELKEEHRNDIHNFIKNDEYKFFPEVILGYTLNYDYNKKNAKSGFNPMEKLLDGGSFTLNTDGVKFSSKSYRSLEGIKTDINTKIVIIDTKDNKDIFSRIDGNHRLSAYENSDGKMTDLNIPFSLVLFTNDLDGDKAQKVIFNNINSKVVPLTSEENLKNIINSDSGFSNKELEKLGKEYLLTRKLKNILNLNILSNIKHFFKNKERTILKELSILLLKDKKINEINESHIIEIFSHVNTIFGEKKTLFQESSYSIFIACIYFYNKGEMFFKKFYNRTISNHIYSLKEINYNDLIGIFEKVSEAKKREIFISMPFNEDTKETYKVIKEAVNEVNNEESLEIKLREIRVDNFEKGYSYAINERIYKLIENTGYFIADLSQGNKNVYNELGYLMGLNKVKNKDNSNFLLIVDNRKGKANEDTGFNVKNLKCIRFKEILKLKDDIKKSIKAYYGI